MAKKSVKQLQIALASKQAKIAKLNDQLKAEKGLIAGLKTDLQVAKRDEAEKAKAAALKKKAAAKKKSSKKASKKK